MAIVKMIGITWKPIRKIVPGIRNFAGNAQECGTAYR